MPEPSWPACWWRSWGYVGPTSNASLRQLPVQATFRYLSTTKNTEDTEVRTCPPLQVFTSVSSVSSVVGELKHVHAQFLIRRRRVASRGPLKVGHYVRFLGAGTTAIWHSQPVPIGKPRSQPMTVKCQVCRHLRRCRHKVGTVSHFEQSKERSSEHDRCIDCAEMTQSPFFNTRTGSCWRLTRGLLQA